MVHVFSWNTTIFPNGYRDLKKSENCDPTVETSYTRKKTWNSQFDPPAGN